MNELYPILLVLMSFFLGIAVFFCFRTSSTQKKRELHTDTTEAIDRLINNSNSGTSVIQYKEALSEYNIHYIAWRVNRNGATK